MQAMNRSELGARCGILQLEHSAPVAGSSGGLAVGSSAGLQYKLPEIHVCTAVQMSVGLAFQLSRSFFFKEFTFDAV